MTNLKNTHGKKILLTKSKNKTILNEVITPRLELILACVASGGRPAHLIMPKTIKNTFEFIEKKVLEANLKVWKYGDAILIISDSKNLPPIQDWKNINSDIWSKILGYSNPLLPKAKNINVYYNVKMRKKKELIHLYWFTICAYNQNELDTKILDAISHKNHIEKNLKKYNRKWLKVSITFQ